MTLNKTVYYDVVNDRVLLHREGFNNRGQAVYILPELRTFTGKPARVVPATCREDRVVKGNVTVPFVAVQTPEERVTIEEVLPGNQWMDASTIQTQLATGAAVMKADERILLTLVQAHVYDEQRADAYDYDEPAF